MKLKITKSLGKIRNAFDVPMVYSWQIMGTVMHVENADTPSGKVKNPNIKNIVLFFNYEVEGDF